MPKYLDMPEGNGSCDAYDTFLSHIDRGRMVSVVRVLHSNGQDGFFIRSGELVDALPSDEGILEAAIFTYKTGDYAESKGHHPIISP